METEKENIQVERDEIEKELKRLGKLKNEAINTDDKLPDQYTIDILTLIARLIKFARHYINGRNQYEAQECERKMNASLGCIAILTKLLNDPTKLIPYPNDPTKLKSIKDEYDSSREDYIIGRNFFDDLAYLALSNIAVALPDPDMSRSVFKLSSNEVFAILNGICDSLKQIVDVETQHYNATKRFDGPLHANTAQTFSSVKKVREKIKKEYASHQRLRALFEITSYYRETVHIESSLEAIKAIQTLSFETPETPLSEEHALGNKRAILRCLTLVGEAFTQINLTRQSKSLTGLSQQDFQLFKRLRDKITHNENDIHLNHMETYIQNQQRDVRLLVDELALLRPELENLLQQLSKLKQDNKLALHYDNQNLVPQYHQERFQTLRTFLNGFSNTRYDNDRNNYPDEFTDCALVKKINTEINAIKRVVELKAIPGRKTLLDPHEENLQEVQNFVSFFQLVYEQTQHQKLGSALQAIKDNSVKCIEFPQSLIAPEFDPVDHPQGQKVKITLEFVRDNSDAIAGALNQSTRKWQFMSYLKGNPTVKLTLEYHIGRFAKLLSNVLSGDELLGTQAPKELRVLRNFIAHDSRSEGSANEALLCRYLAHITQVLPQQLAQVFSTRDAPQIRR